MDLVVSPIGGGDIARGERSDIGDGEDPLQALDFVNNAFEIHSLPSIAKEITARRQIRRRHDDDRTCRIWKPEEFGRVELGITFD